jgi:hypothetical protein
MIAIALLDHFKWERLTHGHKNWRALHEHRPNLIFASCKMQRSPVVEVGYNSLLQGLSLLVTISCYPQLKLRLVYPSPSIVASLHSLSHIPASSSLLSHLVCYLLSSVCFPYIFVPPLPLIREFASGY